MALTELREALIAGFAERGHSNILDIEYSSSIKELKKALGIDYSMIDFIKNEFSDEFEVFVDQEFLPSVRRVLRASSGPSSITSVNGTPKVIQSLPNDTIEQLKLVVLDIVSKAPRVVRDAQELVSYLRQPGSPRLPVELWKKLFNQSVRKMLNDLLQEQNDVIPRKKIKIETSEAPVIVRPSPAPSPQATRNFVQKPPPPLETLVDMQPRSAPAMADLEIVTRPELSNSYLQVIQLAALTGVLSHSEAQGIFSLILDS